MDEKFKRGEYGDLSAELEEASKEEMSGAGMDAMGMTRVSGDFIASDGGTPAYPVKKRGVGKGLAIGGVAVLAVMMVTAGAVFYMNKNKEGGGSGEAPQARVIKVRDDGGEKVFLLTDHGLEEDAASEVVEAKMVELGMFEPGADYSDAPDADTESEEYCGDGSCQELAKREETEIKASESAFTGYTERGENFVKTAINFYVSSVYGEGEASVKAAEGDLNKFIIQVGEIELTARVLTKGKEEGLEVEKITIYNENGKEVFSSSSKYFEY